jgi:AraC family transcriptional regulator of adaptative response / DNA-3-methyladenine glycosylase II
MLETSTCYRALRARDARFDGRFFVGVRTTGVYCRPVCPARTPRLENVSFYPSAAAAQEAGFRPCLRCRPEASPELALWRGTSNTVSRALALIARGGLDGEDADVEALAQRVGVGERQLRRLFRHHLGASPIAVAQTRRVLFAKQLLQETRLPMIEVALASGFGSLRRFNATFRSLYGRPPSALRRRSVELSVSTPRDEAHGVTLFLSYRPPYDWEAILDHFAHRAIPGVETVADGCYRRCVSENGEAGSVEVAHAPLRAALALTVRVPNVRALPGLVGRVKRMFDVAADADVIGAALSTDAALAPLVRQRPGLRVPGGWDGFELAVRAVLGQQVSVSAARKLAGSLVRVCHRQPTAARGESPAFSFPGPAVVAAANLDELGMPRSRKATLKALATACVETPEILEPAASLDEAVTRFGAISGIGDWTAHYIALRALGETDAFPVHDAGLLRAAASIGLASTPRELLARSEKWRPWRAYAAQHLWSSSAGAPAAQKEVSHG